MSEGWRDFDVAVGRWRLGELMAEQLPGAAVEALAAGCEAPSLGQLAGMNGAGWSEVEAVLGRVFSERGRAVPDVDEALKWVADDVVRRIVDGELAPEDASERLRLLSMKAIDGPGWKDLGAFHHLALDWEVAEAAGTDTSRLRSEMLREARELLARGGVRVT